MVYTSSRSTFLAASFSPACRCVSFSFCHSMSMAYGVWKGRRFFFPFPRRFTFFCFDYDGGRFDFLALCCCIIIPLVRMRVVWPFYAPKSGFPVVHGPRLNEGNNHGLNTRKGSLDYFLYNNPSTLSPIAKQLVKPGLSIPSKFTHPSYPCSFRMTKSLNPLPSNMTAPRGVNLGRMPA